MPRTFASHLAAAVVGLALVALPAPAAEPTGDASADLDGFVGDPAKVCFSDAHATFQDFADALLADRWSFVGAEDAAEASRMLADAKFVDALLTFMADREFGVDVRRSDFRAAAYDMYRQHRDHYADVMRKEVANGPAPRVAPGSQLAYFTRYGSLLYFRLHDNGTTHCEFMRRKRAPVQADMFTAARLKADKSGWRNSHLHRVDDDRFVTVADIHAAPFKEHVGTLFLRPEQVVKFLTRQPEQANQ